MSVSNWEELKNKRISKLSELKEFSKQRIFHSLKLKKLYSKWSELYDDEKEQKLY